jgi:hypothetical protein
VTSITNLSDSKEIKKELVVFLRNSDVLSVATRGVTTTTQTFSGNTILTAFTLTSTPVRNVRAITISAVAKAFGTDYTVNYATGVVNFTVAPGSGTNNISVQYDYGSSDKIFSDFPRVDLGITSYPRIALELTSKSSSEMALGATSTLNDYLISIYVFADGGDAVDDLITAIRQAFLLHKKDFYRLAFITPVTEGPLLLEDDRVQKIMSRSLECRSVFNVEEVA